MSATGVANGGSSSIASSSITSPPSMETVAAAIQSLYHNRDPKEQERASAWLQELQKSVYAWKVADELLHRKLDVESCYIAAQTMRSKIQSSFHELPIEAHVSLRDSLLEHLTNVEQSNSVIVTQLSLALAGLILLMPEWKGAVHELIDRFGSSPGKSCTLLEILVVLPEEVHSRHLRLGAIRRKEVLAELSDSSHRVNEFLKHSLTAEERNPQSQITIIKCLTSWIQIGAINVDNIEQNLVMIHSFRVLASPDSPAMLHEAAADCVCVLLHRLEELERVSGNLELNLYTVVRNMEEPYHLAVANEDTDKAVNYCRVFTELGETMLLKIVNFRTQPHFAMGILDSVLMCCGHPDYEVPDITFNLWYRLSEELYEKNNDWLTAQFRPYIERLINALCKHCQMEPDTEGILEEGEDFTEFRLRVTELIKDVVFIVGSSEVFQHMLCNNLKSQPLSWELMEASLFIMTAVARNILPNENRFVPQVLENVLAGAESAHIAVRHTSLRLVGELCEWLDHHPQYLERILNWLLLGLQHPKLASEAATSLQNVCSECRKHMTPHFDGLILILKSLDSFNLKPAAAAGLIKGVAVILSDMPHEQIAAAMKTLCLLQVVPLNQILDMHQVVNGSGDAAGSKKIAKNTTSDPVLFLDRLAAVFRHVLPHVTEGSIHPCVGVFQEIWPVISRTFEKFRDNVRVMERTCRIIRFAVRAVGTQSAPLLEPLVKQMVSIYQVHPHSCFLYLGSILVDEYAHIPGCVNGLLGMLQQFMSPTYTLLQEVNGLRNHPDTVDDFFRLNARFLQRAAVPYLQTNFIKSIIECALLASSLDHREANASVMKFFYDLLHAGRSKDDKEDFELRRSLVLSLRNEYGSKLIDCLIKATIFNLPSYTFHDIGDVIYELMLHERPPVCLWLEATLKSLPTVNAHGMPTVTREQLVAFHKGVTSAEDAKDVTAAIREFTRLWK